MIAITNWKLQILCQPYDIIYSFSSVTKPSIGRNRQIWCNLQFTIILLAEGLECKSFKEGITKENRKFFVKPSFTRPEGLAREDYSSNLPDFKTGITSRASYGPYGFQHHSEMSFPSLIPLLPGSFLPVGIYDETL